jgi:DNA (cytosine-5)-methyltransferase 1
MLNGLDLFSGIGGLSIALSEWVRPIAYCEIDPYCQGVLLTRQNRGDLMSAPIWDDVSTLEGSRFKHCTDIIYGGFPCQDISVAGRGKGLEGKRSGLYWQIHRLVKEIHPKFVFLENVPGISIRGGIEVVNSLAEMGYDCRWCNISAASIGAPHKRERWFLLAYAKYPGRNGVEEQRSSDPAIYDGAERADSPQQPKRSDTSRMLASKSTAHTVRPGGQQIFRGAHGHENQNGTKNMHEFKRSSEMGNFWTETESPLCGVADGIPQRVDRLRALGNAVVPRQAKEAFKILMGYAKEG